MTLRSICGPYASLWTEQSQLEWSSPLNCPVRKVRMSRKSVLFVMFSPNLMAWVFQIEVWVTSNNKRSVFWTYNLIDNEIKLKKIFKLQKWVKRRSVKFTRWQSSNFDYPVNCPWTLCSFTDYRVNCPWILQFSSELHDKWSLYVVAGKKKGMN